MTVGLALAVGFTAGWIPFYVFRAEAVAASLPVYTPTERRWLRVTHAVLTLHTTAACMAVSWVTDIAPWSAAASVAAFAAAIVFWFRARMLIGPLRRRRTPDEPPTVLQRVGPFRIVRHPLYCAYLVAAAAPLLVARQPLLLVSFAACVMVLAVRAIQEERWLHAQLGPVYEQYCREVKRLVPFVW